MPSAKLLAVFVLPSGPTQSCQGRNEKSTSRVRGGICLPSLQRRRDRDGQLALGLPAGKAAYEALLFTQKVVINDHFDMLAL